MSCHQLDGMPLALELAASLTRKMTLAEIAERLNDEMAMGVLHTARRHKLRVPEDVSVVGVDDIRYSRYFDPPLTTVAQPMRDMGVHAVRVLIDILHEEHKPPESVRLPVT